MVYLDPATCTHAWVIETPNGPTSEGVCKLCGKEQEFRNSFENTSALVGGIPLRLGPHSRREPKKPRYRDVNRRVRE